MKYLLSFTLFVAPVLVNAEQDACKVMDITTLSYVENVQDVATADVGAIYQAKTESLSAFAKQHNLEDFKILSQDASVSANCCGNFGLQVHMSYQIAYKPSYKALTALQKHSGSGMLSTHRTGMESCAEDK
ncbi:hypothetical protein [Rheinheimera pleomorphica]|uniref:hypothetical protein n=1 Tax=Rheinheimera pleomorphica TaxID=2703963 RepID=UPI00142431A0|nr:hypothetical protein [Rheinheimera pleomorphica]